MSYETEFEREAAEKSAALQGHESRAEKRKIEIEAEIKDLETSFLDTAIDCFLADDTNEIFGIRKRLASLREERELLEQIIPRLHEMAVKAACSVEIRRMKKARQQLEEFKAKIVSGEMEQAEVKRLAPYYFESAALLHEKDLFEAFLNEHGITRQNMIV